jgi:hypothetical protein
MNMNAKKWIATLAALTATAPVFAQSSEFIDFVNVPSTKSHAQVMSELNDAQMQSTYANGRQEFVTPDANFASSKTRAQVLAELRQSQDDGSYAMTHQQFETQYPVLNQGHASSDLAAHSQTVSVDYGASGE